MLNTTSRISTLQIVGEHVPCFQRHWIYRVRDVDSLLTMRSHQSHLSILSDQRRKKNEESKNTEKKAGVNHSFLEWFTHFSSPGYHGGNLNAYLAYPMTCSGQPMDTSALYPFPTSRVQFTAPGELVGLVGRQILTKNLYRVQATASSSEFAAG